MKNNLFRNKYRIPSARLQNWDYRWNASYFITICTKNRIHYFGNINDRIMKLSPIGILADIFLYEIKNHSTNIEPDIYIIMPDHIHCILTINNKLNKATGNDTDKAINNNTDKAINNDTDKAINNDTDKAINEDTDKACLVSNSTETKNPANHKSIGSRRFQNQGKNSISSIIGSYKSAVTKHAHRIGFEFAWQPRFYDHIIRDPASYRRIFDYIVNNPENWKSN